MSDILKIQECMKNKENNDFFFNFLIGCIIDIINPNCLEPYGRYIIFGNDTAEIFSKKEIDYTDLIKMCLYVFTNRLVAIYITSFIVIKDIGEMQNIRDKEELRDIDWEYLKNRCSKTIPIYTEFLKMQLDKLDEKSVLLFNREKRKIFQNKELFEEVPFQMPLPKDIKPNDLNLYKCNEA